MLFSDKPVALTEEAGPGTLVVPAEYDQEALLTRSLNARLLGEVAPQLAYVAKNGFSAAAFHPDVSRVQYVLALPDGVAPGAPSRLGIAPARHSRRAMEQCLGKVGNRVNFW